MIGNTKIFENLRRISENIEDFRLAVKLKTVIACATQNKADIASALEKARGHHQAVTAEALAIIVNVLSKARQFDEARAIVGNRKRGITGEMAGLDTYWHAEASIILAEFSREPDDVDEARFVISNIRSQELREDTRADLEIALGSAKTKTPQANPYFRLVAVLSELQTSMDGHAIHPQPDTVHLHALADSILDCLLIRALK